MCIRDRYRAYGMDLIEFRPLKKENPMGEARKDALRLDFDRRQNSL